MVKAPENTPEALLAALKDGAFYSTQGPELRDVRIEDKKVVVDSSAVASVIVQGAGTAATAVHGESLTTARIALSRFANSDWIRGDGDRPGGQAGLVEPDLAGSRGPGRAGVAAGWRLSGVERQARTGALPPSRHGRASPGVFPTVG